MVASFLILTTGHLEQGRKRHTGVLEGAPSSESASRESHGERMPREEAAMRYFTRQLQGGVLMSREDALCLASRVLAFLFMVWALWELSYLPDQVQSFLHYAEYQTTPST